jgi:hypothetical protein
VLLQSRRISCPLCKQQASDAIALGLSVAADGTASEPGNPEDREQEPDEPDGDPDPRNEEEEDDSDHDQCDGYADHESRVPA